MAKRMMEWSLGALALCAASLAWAGSADPAPAVAAHNRPSAPAKTDAKPPQAAEPALGNPGASGSIQGTVAPESETAPRPVLAEAFIAQSVLRVYLNRPAAIFVYNSRGQQVFHLDSQSPMEAVPLQGITTGFIYLTVRTAQGELTKKLVYTGK